MGKKSPEELAELPQGQLLERLQTCQARNAERMERAENEGRAPTAREHALSLDDLEEISAIEGVLAVAAKRERAGDALRELHRMAGERGTRGRSPFLPSAETVEQLERARRDQQTLTLLERAATTDLGTARTYAANTVASPRALYQVAGVPVTAPDGLDAVVPTFDLPAGVALVAEGAAHAEFSAITPDSLTLGRAGAFSTLTAAALISTSINEVSQAHARIIARDVDLATLTKLEAATPVTITVDEALVTVAAEASVDPTELVVAAAPADAALLIGGATRTPASGPDTESFAVRYQGAIVYPTPAASAGVYTILHGGSLRAFVTPLASGVVTDPTSGGQQFGSWLHFAIGVALNGSVISTNPA